MTSNLETQLRDWCVKRTASGDKITWEQLEEKAVEIRNNIGGPSILYKWLQRFIKREDIRIEYNQNAKFHLLFLKWQLRKYQKADEQLFNWLLELIISGDIISFDLLEDKTKNLMEKLSRDEALKVWLRLFRKCHEILINSVTVKKKGGKVFQQSDKVDQLATHEICLKKQKLEFKQYNYKECTSLEKQLINWLLEQKKSGVTISHTMLRDETLRLIIDEFDGSSSKLEKENWLWKIAHRYFLPVSYTFEMLQCKIKALKEDCNRVLSNKGKQFIFKLNERIEEKNINKNNIYFMIQTDAIWKTHVQMLLEFAERKKIKEEIAKKEINVDKLMKSVTAMFCTNVTGSHKLPPITGEVTYDDETLEGDVVTKGSKEFTFWYNNLFKECVRDHQLKENITGKVLLLVEDCMQHILSENIIQDDDFEILIFPTNAVSFCKPLCPELIKEVNRIFESDMSKRIDKLTNLYNESLVKEFNRTYNINFHVNTICKSWLLVKIESTEELWKTFLEQDRQTQEDLVLSTAQLVNYLIKLYS